jgi:prepilin-type N-terminal cleavage/methylation domain-containing protein
MIIKNSHDKKKFACSAPFNTVNFSESGFSLLEVMIVLTILATLTVLTSQSIQNAVRSKVKIDYLNDDMGRVRDALRIMQRDVELIYHCQDLELEIKNLIKEKRNKLFTDAQKKGTPSNPGGASPPPSKPNTTETTIQFNPNDPNDPLNQKSPNRMDPTTHLIGSEDKVYFVTMNNSRINDTNPSADFIKVGYELEKCKKVGQDKESLCIIRKSSPIAEGDLTQGGEKNVLLENVSEFKLRYLGKEKQDWTSDWNTMNGDASTKGKFPDAIEISVKTEREENKKMICIPTNHFFHVEAQVLVGIGLDGRERLAL